MLQELSFIGIVQNKQSKLLFLRFLDPVVCTAKCWEELLELEWNPVLKSTNFFLFHTLNITWMVSHFYLTLLVFLSPNWTSGWFPSFKFTIGNRE
jgi:hypothetical protein